MDILSKDTLALLKYPEVRKAIEDVLKEHEGFSVTVKAGDKEVKLTRV